MSGSESAASRKCLPPLICGAAVPVVVIMTHTLQAALVIVLIGDCGGDAVTHAIGMEFH